MKDETLTADDVRAMLRRACEEAGGKPTLARNLGCTTSYVDMLLSGRRPPSKKILAAFGLRQETSFVVDRDGKHA